MGKPGQEILFSRRERVNSYKKVLTPTPVQVVGTFGASRPITSIRMVETDSAPASVNVWIVPTSVSPLNEHKFLPTTPLEADVGYIETAPVDGALYRLSPTEEVWASAPTGNATIYVNVYDETGV